MKIRGRAPRLVLRTACETLPDIDRNRVLALNSTPPALRRRRADKTKSDSVIIAHPGS
jgi:hypothetical protein